MTTFAIGVTLTIDSPQLQRLIDIGERIMSGLSDLADKIDAVAAANAALQTQNAGLAADAVEIKGKLDNLILVAMSTKDALAAAIAGGATQDQLAAWASKLDGALASAQAASADATAAKGTLDEGDVAADEAAVAVAP